MDLWCTEVYTCWHTWPAVPSLAETVIKWTKQQRGNNCLSGSTLLFIIKKSKKPSLTFSTAEGKYRNLYQLGTDQAGHISTSQQLRKQASTIVRDSQRAALLSLWRPGKNTVKKHLVQIARKGATMKTNSKIFPNTIQRKQLFREHEHRESQDSRQRLLK